MSPTDAATPTPRTLVITGASSGIGAVAAARLAEQGDTVVVVGRNPERTRAVAERIGPDGAAPEWHLADFSRFDDVRALAASLADRHERIDVLLNNAGGLVSQRTRTDDGHEATLQSNLLAHYLLTRLLLPQLRAGAAAAGSRAAARSEGRGRVITTSSVANRLGRIDLADLDFERHPWAGGWRAYGAAKLGVILFTRELARREAQAASGVEAYSVHPGAVNTEFGATSPLIRIGNALTGSRWGITAEVGAAPLLALASATPVPAASGSYLDRMHPNGRTAAQADDAALQAELWRRCAELTGLPTE